MIAIGIIDKLLLPFVSCGEFVDPLRVGDGPERAENAP
jgi:hypothetical protein